MTPTRPGWWLRLWGQHPAHPALLNWAVARLAASAASPEGAWSRVWEAVWHHAQGDQRTVLGAAARKWLLTQGRRADWHFVWKALQSEASTEGQALVDLLVHALPHEVGAHWAHVWQEALSSPPFGGDLAALLTQGCAWLDGRDDKDQWAFVLQALLANGQHLPEGWDVPRLTGPGLAFVERAVVADSALPILKGFLAHCAELPATQQERLDALLARWMPVVGGLPAGPASHFIEAMLDAGLAGTAGLCGAAIGWCQTHRHHQSWPLILVKALIAWPIDRRLLDLVGELGVWVGQHPNAGWLHKAEGLLRTVDVNSAEPEMSALVSSITGAKPYGVFVRVNLASGLILASELPPNPGDWELLLPARSRWRVRILKHTSKGFNAVLVDPPWSQV